MCNIYLSCHHFFLFDSKQQNDDAWHSRYVDILVCMAANAAATILMCVHEFRRKK